jgi:hypothetical protein
MSEIALFFNSYDPSGETVRPRLDASSSQGSAQQRQTTLLPVRHTKVVVTDPA